MPLRPQSPEDLDIALNNGEIQDSVEPSGSPNLDKLFQELFSDDEDEFSPTTLVVDIPRPPSVVKIPPLAPASTVTQRFKRHNHVCATQTRILSYQLMPSMQSTPNSFDFGTKASPVGAGFPGKDEDEVQEIAAVNVATAPRRSPG